MSSPSPSPAKRGRGRPLKPKPEVTSGSGESPEVGSPNPGCVIDRMSSLDMSSPSSPPVKRGRGRPPKPKPEVSSGSGGSLEADSPNSSNVIGRRSSLDMTSPSPSPAKRGRGRPPKPKPEVTPGSGESPEVGCPKSGTVIVRRGRGRPTKSALASKFGCPPKIVSSSVPKRPRGRPRKYPPVMRPKLSRGRGRPRKSTKQGCPVDTPIGVFYRQMKSMLKSIFKAGEYDTPEILRVSVMFIQTILEHFTQRYLTLHLKLWINKSSKHAFLVKPPARVDSTEDPLCDVNSVVKAIQSVSSPDDISPIAKFVQLLSEKYEKCQTEEVNKAILKDTSSTEQTEIAASTSINMVGCDLSTASITPEMSQSAAGSEEATIDSSSESVMESLCTQDISDSNRPHTRKKSIRHVIAKMKPSLEKSWRQASDTSSIKPSAVKVHCKYEQKPVKIAPKPVRIAPKPAGIAPSTSSEIEMLATGSIQPLPSSVLVYGPQSKVDRGPETDGRVSADRNIKGLVAEEPDSTTMVHRSHQTQRSETSHNLVPDKPLKEVRVTLSDVIITGEYRKRKRATENIADKSKRKRFISPKMAEMMKFVKVKEERRLARKQSQSLDIKEEIIECDVPSVVPKVIKVNKTSKVKLTEVNKSPKAKSTEVNKSPKAKVTEFNKSPKAKITEVNEPHKANTQKTSNKQEMAEACSQGEINDSHKVIETAQALSAEAVTDETASYFPVQFDDDMEEEMDESGPPADIEKHTESDVTHSTTSVLDEGTVSQSIVISGSGDAVKDVGLLPEATGSSAAVLVLANTAALLPTASEGTDVEAVVSVSSAANTSALISLEGKEERTPLENTTAPTSLECKEEGPALAKYEDGEKPDLSHTDWHSFRCRYCHAEGRDVEYADWKELQGHIRAAHIVCLSKDEEGLECPFCPHTLKSFTRNFAKIIYRMNIHVGKKHQQTLPMPGKRSVDVEVKGEIMGNENEFDISTDKKDIGPSSILSSDEVAKADESKGATPENTAINKRFLGFLKGRNTRIRRQRDKKLKNLFSCNLCVKEEGKGGSFLQSKPHLIRHMQEHHATESGADVVLTCHLCQETFTSSPEGFIQIADQLLEHLLYQHDVIYLRCVTIEDWKKMMEDEVPMVHEDGSGVWRCILCNESEKSSQFAKCSLLTKHILDDHMGEDCLLHCPECKVTPRTFSLMSWEEALLLVDHFVLSHNILHATHSTSVLYTDGMAEVLTEAEVPEEKEPIAETTSGYIVHSGYEKEEVKLKYDSRSCFMCPDTDDGFLISDGSYLEHIRNHHVQDVYSEESPILESALICPKCDYQVVRSACVMAAPGPLPHILNTMLVHMIKVHSTAIPDFTKLFYCTRCGYETLRKADYYEHLSKAHYQKACLPYGGVKDQLKSCPACEETLPKKYSWRNHRKKCVAIGGEEVQRRLKCKLCEATFAWAYQLKEHLSTNHTEEERLSNTATCPECSITCCDTRALWRHRWRKHKVNCFNEELVACAKCGETMPPSFVSVHEGEHVKRDAAQQRWEEKKAKRARGEKVDRFMPYQCSICGKKVPNRYILKNHERQHDADSTVLECGFCGYKTGSQKKAMIMKKHMETKHGIVTYRCRICRVFFDNQPLLEAHMAEKHPEGSLVNFCTLCSLQFSSKHLYQNHMFEIHEKNVSARPVLSCPACPFQTLGRMMLVRHMATHKELHAPCPICGKTFSTQAICDTHVRRYHQGKKYKCPQCQFGCNLESTLRRHQAMHHLTTQYRCQQCPYLTYKLERFVQHMQDEHQTQIHNTRMLRDFVRDQDFEAAYSTIAPVGTSEADAPVDEKDRPASKVLQEEEMQALGEGSVIVALTSDVATLPISGVEGLVATPDTRVLSETPLLLGDLAPSCTITGSASADVESPQVTSDIGFTGDPALPSITDDVSAIDPTDVQPSEVTYGLPEVPSETLRTYTITIPDGEEAVPSQLNPSSLVFGQNPDTPSEPLLQTFTLPTEIPGVSEGVEYVYLSGIPEDQETVILETVGRSMADESGQEVQYIYITEEPQGGSNRDLSMDK